MPRFDGSAMETHQIGGSNFNFTGTRIQSLGATEYTLVTIAIDVTWSVEGFEQELRQMLITAIDACRKSPRSNNLLVRVILFSTALGAQGVQEIHGFKPLADLDVNSYPQLQPRGATPLCDATYSAVGATIQYGSDLMANDFLANAIVFLITDGEENSSKTTPAMIKAQINDVRLGEKLESLITILIGINAAACQASLTRFKTDAGLTEYKDAGDATPQNLAKLAQFVSKSVSSQSQALGTGGPSQSIPPTI